MRGRLPERPLAQAQEEDRPDRFGRHLGGLDLLRGTYNLLQKILGIEQ